MKYSEFSPNIILSVARTDGYACTQNPKYKFEEENHQVLSMTQTAIKGAKKPKLQSNPNKQTKK